MRRPALYGLLALALSCSSGYSVGQAVDPPARVEQFATAESARIEDFAWFTGCWSMTLPDGIIEEHWLPPAGGAMIGMSRTIRGGLMKEYEFLALRSVEGKLAYVSIPSRQRETAFALVRYKHDAAVFENLDHDFPQRIVYRKTDTGITAIIEGNSKGKMRSAEFVYTACPQP